MRLTALTVLILATACAVDSISNPTHPATPRPERPNLLTGSDKLRGLALVATDGDGWAYRVTRAHRDRLASGTARTGSDDFYLGAGRSSGPGSAGPTGGSGPATGGPSGPTTGGPSGPVSLGTPARPPISSLRAGCTDDNVEFADFVAFLESAREQAAWRERFVDIDVAGRSALQVVDVEGQAVPGTPVTIIDEAGDRVVWRGTTYGDGRVPFYSATADDCLYMIEVPVGERVVRHMWDGKSDTEVRLPTRRTQSEAIALDVVFVIDTTGSMGDEIAAIKATLLQTTTRLRALGREFDLRYGAVLYRDIGDQYVTAQHDFTGDIEAFDEVLGRVEASGGGDGPESLNQGLAVAVDGMKWRPDAAKVAFLIADAPPHLDYDNDVPYDESLRAAVARGIRIHTVAASGLGEVGSLVFRQIAQFTRGEFVFIEYGGDLKASAERHGVKKATGNNLDDILFTRIRDEIARWGRGDPVTDD